MNGEGEKGVGGLLTLRNMDRVSGEPGPLPD